MIEYIKLQVLVQLAIHGSLLIIWIANKLHII